MTTDTLENANAFAQADAHEGDPRVIAAQAKSACRTLLKEVERLRLEVAYQTAAAAYYEHDGECCGGCLECGRLYEAMTAAEKARSP